MSDTSHTKKHPQVSSLSPKHNTTHSRDFKFKGYTKYLDCSDFMCEFMQIHSEKLQTLSFSARRNMSGSIRVL